MGKLSSTGVITLAVTLAILTGCAGGRESTDLTESTEADVGGVVVTTSVTTQPPAPDIIELVVGPELQECVGVDVRTCMVVQRPGSDEWTFFYSEIVGFEHRAGVESTLLVERTQVVDPQADDSSYDYRLVEVLDSVSVDPGDG